jgi:hypothetical protein
MALAESARLQRYREYLAFYEGRHYPAPRAGRTNLVVNYARAIVDKGVSFLMGQGIGFAVEGDAAAEALLYAVYDTNDLDAVDLACATNAAVLGDGVYKVFWDADQERIRVVSVDPCGFFAHWRADDLATLQRVDLVYRLPAADAAALVAPSALARTSPNAREPQDAGLAAPAARRATLRGPALLVAGPAEQVEVVETWTAATLCVAVDGTVWREERNPYGTIPFVHVPNLPPPNSFWGRSDLADVIPLNRELNERLSDQADAIRFHADPPVVFMGVEGHDAVRIGPGTVWDLPPGADVKLLEWRGSGPAVREHIELVLRALYETAETPRTAFGDNGRQLSGVALETELRPLVQKTLRKRVVWTAALRRRCRLIFHIAERVGLLPEGAARALRPRVIWPAMLPQDLTREVAANVALVSAGLRSHRTAMDVLGVEAPEEELARVRADRAALATPGAGDGPMSGAGGPR